MRIDFLASEPHYFDHIAPIWAALPEAMRGGFHVRPAIAPYATQKGVSANTRLLSAAEGGPVVVAGYADVRRVKGRPVILAEHGVGNRYRNAAGEWDRNPSNPGGRGREAVALFLCPNIETAEANLEVYPDAKVAVVGSPKMDRHHLESAGALGATTKDLGAEGQRTSGVHAAQTPKAGSQDRGAGHVTLGHPPLTIALSWHWDCRQVPETRWAFPHFADAVRQLPHDLGPDYHVIGHGHPRAWRRLRAFYEDAGIEPVEDFEDVLDRADLYVCDTSSTLYEFASTGRPVLCLNAPWYRFEATHGLRFWDALPGVPVGEPVWLARMVAVALDPDTDALVAKTLREPAVRRAYAFTDGRAAERAVQAIREVFVDD